MITNRDGLVRQIEELWRQVRTQYGAPIGTDLIYDALVELVELGSEFEEELPNHTLYNFVKKVVADLDAIRAIPR
jgi:hypothetical protein